MAKSIFILMLALSLALFVSCNGKGGNNKSETTETITETPVEQASTETEMPVEEEDEFIMPIEQAPTYYNFVGKVAGTDVHMSLELDHTNVKGRYYYDSQSKKATSASMKFFGESHGAHITFTEFYSDKPTGTFDGYWNDDLFQGTFTRAKDGKTFDFSLTSVYAAIEPGGGEAFFQDFDDFYFDIPFLNSSNPSQGQTVDLQSQPTEKEVIQYIKDNAIEFDEMCQDYNNPIMAKEKYPYGKDIILKLVVSEIGYSSDSQYKYILTYDDGCNKALIYTNDEGFVTLSYPQVVWIEAIYSNRYDEGGRGSKYDFVNVFKDAKLLLYKGPEFYE